MMTEDQKIKKQVESLGIPIVGETPYDDVADASIELGGEFEGVSISIGYGYYSVFKKTSSNTFLSVEGKGDLKAEILKIKGL